MKVFFFFLFLFSSLQASTPLRVSLDSKAAILINAETGAVLYEKEADLSLYPASITKIITAFYALEKKRGALEEKVTASREAVLTVSSHSRRGGQHPPYRLEFGGTHISIKPDEQLSFSTLLHGLMLSSANDAANVIAEHVSGDISRFIEELNAFVKALGCHKTQLYTPHGLPHPDHKTTARDMANITKYALKNPHFSEIVKKIDYPRNEDPSQPKPKMSQFNALLTPGPFFYPKAIGVKTGFTQDAGYTLVAAAEDNHRKLIVVLLGCRKIEQRYKDAIALFEAAFNEEKISRVLFSQGFDLFSSTVLGAKALLQACLVEDVKLSFYPSEEPVVHSTIDWEIPPLPILAGQQVGHVKIYSDQGALLVLSPLFAKGRVDPTFSHRIYQLWGATKIQLKKELHWILAILGMVVLLLTFRYTMRRNRPN